MKKNILTILIVGWALYSYSSNLVVKPENPKYDSHLLLPGTNTNISVSQFITLKPIEYKNRTGKRLSLKKFIALKLLQKKIKVHLRKEGKIDTFKFYNKDKKPFKWHWGGFFLGIFLPFIGLIIAGIIKKDEKKWDRINSAAIATAIVSVIFSVIVFITLANSF